MTYPGSQPSGGPGAQWGPPASSQPYVPQAGYTVGGGYPPAPGYQPGGPPPMRAVPAAPNGQPLANFGDRLLAYLLDALIIGGITIVVMIPAMIAMVFVFTNVFEDVQTDPVTGEITNGPGAGAVILPIVLISVVVLGLIFGASYVYYVEMLYKRGTTIGKRAMKLRIIRLDEPDQPLTRGIAARRWAVWQVVGSFVPFFSYVDGLWQLWDKPYQQCLHDKWARTVVVKVSA